MFEESIRYLHISSMALWFGGLFCYVLIVWPSIFHTHQPAFPRKLLSLIAMRTAPWIYLGMASALGTSIIYVFGSFNPHALPYRLLYLLILALLVANNMYGSIIAWPKIMLSPDSAAVNTWNWFYMRMVVSLAGGLILLSVAITMT